MVELTKNQEYVYGLNPVRLALEANRRQFLQLVVSAEDAEVNPVKLKILELGKSRGLEPLLLPSFEIEKAFPDAKHQGALLAAAKLEIDFLADDQLLHKPYLLALDQVQDPQNLGAIIRSAAYFGMHGLIFPKDRSCPINADVSRFSAGMLEVFDLYQVTNLAVSLDDLKQKGYWIVGTDIEGENLFSFDPPERYVLVLGNESKGIRRLVKEKSDFIVTIPGEKTQESLNVSVSAGVIMAYLAHKIKK